MLCPDLPITKSDDDVLNRGSFAESLAKTIVQYSSPSSLTIGLYGRWGSGKTSLLNIIFENVEKIDDSVAIIRFDPWLCSDPRQLVTQFFKQMATAIKVKKPKAEKVWELIDQYADVFDLTSFLNVRGIAVVPFFRILAKIAKKQAEQRSKDVQKSKEQIAARLSKEKLKIVVSIDDIKTFRNGLVTAATARPQISMRIWTQPQRKLRAMRCREMWISAQMLQRKAEQERKKGKNLGENWGKNEK